MESLKILLTNTFYPPFHVGGDATHVQQLAELLAKEGHEIHVIYSLDAFSMKKVGKKTTNTKLEGKNMIKQYPLHSPYSFFEPIRTYVLGYSNWINKSIRKVIEQIHPDIIHHHNYSLLGNKIFNLNELIGKSLITFHDYYPICQQNSLFKYGRNLCLKSSCFQCSFLIKRPYQLWRHTFLNKLILKNNYFISPSNFLKKTILKRIKDPELIEPKFEVIPNFLNPIEIKTNENYSTRFGEYFVYSGKVTRIKGVQKLIKFFPEFNKDFPEINLVVIGTGPLHSSLSKLIHRLKLEKKVHFLGRMEYIENLEIIRSAQGLILPSIWWENCPMTLIEAVYNNVIPIATDLGGMSEIVAEIDPRLLINPHSFDSSLYEILKAILESKFNIQSSHLKNIYHKKYSPSAFLKAYYRLIK